MRKSVDEIRALVDGLNGVGGEQLALLGLWRGGNHRTIALRQIVAECR